MQQSYLVPGVGATGQQYKNPGDHRWHAQSIAGMLPNDVVRLYQRREDGPNGSGSIWRYTGTPCINGSCTGWELLDNNTPTISIVTGGIDLYKMHNDGAIWIYIGPRRWQLLDNNPQTRQIATGPRSLYQRREDGSIWRYTGPRCSDDGKCQGWELLDRIPKRMIFSTRN